MRLFTVGKGDNQGPDLLTLQHHENPMYLPRGAAALTSKLKAQESSLNANGIYFKIGRDTERYVMVSGKPLAA